VGTKRTDRPTRGHEAAAVAEVTGRPLLPWQSYTLDVGLETTGDRAWAYRDVGIAVARQNGKTGGILETRILTGLLLWAERILHSAQNRELPRESFLAIADILETRFASRLAARPRRANGQETVRMRNGGSYRIIAPRPDAPRGHVADLVVIDEIREYRDTAFVSAILPTLNTSANPQVWYASNAGDPDSVILNGLRDRGLEADPTLAWLEYSADPALADDDPLAWQQANPSLGTLIDRARIEHLHATLTPEAFQTEVLCRWVDVSGTRAIPAALWEAATDPGLTGPTTKPVLSVDIDPDRQAAAVAAAWQTVDGRIGTDLVLYRTGNLDHLTRDVTAEIARLGPAVIGYDPWTTQALADELTASGLPMTPVTGRAWVAACQTLLDLLTTDRLRHPGRDVLDTQLSYAARRETVEGRWWIARGIEPIPAVTATARAVSLAARPRPLYAIH
jgi:phage terminase large subunit-like protein